MACGLFLHSLLIFDFVRSRSPIHFLFLITSEHILYFGVKESFAYSSDLVMLCNVPVTNFTISEKFLPQDKYF